MQLLKGLFKSQTTYVIAFAFLIVYVGIRSSLVNMTHDEAHSFHNIKNFWYAEFLCTANSHWLNSLAMKIALVFNCESVFCLRWFSVFSFIVTCCFGYWFIRSVEIPGLKALAFCLLFLNPYLLDYFGLARGYAGSIMFQCISLLLFIKGFERKNRQFLFTSLAASGFSAIANYSFVYYFFAFSVIYFYWVHFKEKRRFFSKAFLFDMFFCMVITSLIIRALIFMIKCSNDFVGAGEPSFLSMFHIFPDGFLYNKIELNRLWKHALSLLLFSFIALACYYGIAKYKAHNNRLYYFTSIVLSIMIVFMTINYYCFGLVFPYYRSALLLFIPAISILILFARFKLMGFRFFIAFSFSLCILLIVNFFLDVNMKYTLDFKEQADSEDCFNRVKNLKAKHIGISPELYGVFANYYQTTDTKKYEYIGDFIHTWRPKGLCPVNNKLAEYDYLILFPPYDISYYKNSLIKLNGIYLSPTTKNLILRVQKKP
jgi:hypothetical protein